MKKSNYLFLLVLPFFIGHPLRAKTCQGFGPQTPRDIALKKGANNSSVSFAPSSKKLNLCNIHFHTNAEHKGPGFSTSGGQGDHGGWKCNGPQKKSTHYQKNHKKGCGHLNEGDTVEVHWVFSSCDVGPGKGLGSCFSDACKNPQIRVEAQVFLAIDDKNALNFLDYRYEGKKNGTHQPKHLPSDNHSTQFIGSTTGPSYSEEKCSPFQVSWSVRPECLKIDINSLNEWCQKNPFGEDHAHGVRQIVTNPQLLSPIN